MDFSAESKQTQTLGLLNKDTRHMTIVIYSLFADRTLTYSVAVSTSSPTGLKGSHGSLWTTNTHSLCCRRGWRPGGMKRRPGAVGFVSTQRWELISGQGPPPPPRGGPQLPPPSLDAALTCTLALGQKNSDTSGWIQVGSDGVGGGECRLCLVCLV